MTAAVRGTILVIAALAGATAAAAIGILTSPAARGGEAQDFWREIQPAPKKVRRIYVTYRLRRAVVRHVADRGWPDARDTNRSQAGSRASVPEPRSVLGGARPFAGAFVIRSAQRPPAGDDFADSFARRAVLPEPPRNIYVPPDLMQRDQGPQFFIEPQERREPSDNRRRELCVAAFIVVAVLGSVASYLSIPNRGIVHV